MKILMVLDEIFPPDIRVEKEARTLLKAGHELSLLSLGVNGKPSEEVIEGMKVIRTELPPPKMILRRVWDQFRFTFNFIDNFWQKALAKAIEQNKPEVLHIHDFRMVKVGLLDTADPTYGLGYHEIKAKIKDKWLREVFTLAAGR